MRHESLDVGTELRGVGDIPAIRIFQHLALGQVSPASKCDGLCVVTRWVSQCESAWRVLFLEVEPLGQTLQTALRRLSQLELRTGRG